MKTRKQTTIDDATQTTQRSWSDLKPGDTIHFGPGWYEVFDAYVSGHDTVTIKLIINDTPLRPHIKTYRVRPGASMATCRA